MSNRPVRLLLEDILESIERIEEYISGLDRDGFFNDKKTMDAVVRNLEIIGEASNRLPEDFISCHPRVQWRRIIGLRHRIVHGYFGVDYEIIWQIVQIELERLKKEIALLREQIEQEGESSQ